jgi:hypothetical protein
MGTGSKYEGAPAQLGAPFTSYLSPLTSYLSPSLLPRHQLCQPALLPGGRILVNDALLGGTIQKLDGFCVRGDRLRAGCSTHLPERGPEGTPVRTVLNGAGATLTHALCGGLDTGQGNLGD